MAESVGSEDGKARVQLRVVKRPGVVGGREPGASDCAARPPTPDRCDGAPYRHLISRPDAAFSWNLQELTRMALGTLTPRERQLLHLRFGIGGTPALSTEGMARRFAMTREQVLVMETKALRKLRHPIRAVPLKSVIPS